MSARRMAYTYDAGQIQFVRRGNLPQEVGRLANIAEHLWEIAAVTMPTIFDIPDGEARFGQGRGDAAHRAQVVDRTVAAAMDQHDDGVWRVGFRQRQLAELLRIIAVRIMELRLRPGKLQVIVGRQKRHHSMPSGFADRSRRQRAIDGRHW